MKPTLNPLQTFLKELEQTSITSLDFRCIAINRVNFDLSTPLLKQFIECNEKGFPIDEPLHYDYYLETEKQNGFSEQDRIVFEQWIFFCKQFQQAQKEVLFDGCRLLEYKQNSTVASNGIEAVIEINKIRLFEKRNNKWILNHAIKSYSDLTKYNLTTNENFKELIYGK